MVFGVIKLFAILYTPSYFVAYVLVTDYPAHLWPRPGWAAAHPKAGYISYLCSPGLTPCHLYATELFCYIFHYDDYRCLSNHHNYK